jgi:threonine dehydratase
VALAAKRRGIPAVIVMPQTTPSIKVQAVLDLGAEVVLHGDEYDSAYDRALALTRERNYVFVHAFDDPDVIAGQGTVGMEMMEQAAALHVTPDLVLVGASGGGLIGGVSLAVKEASPGTQIYSVEPAGFDDLARSLAHGERQRNERLSGSICDALMSAMPGEITFEVARRNLVGGLSVTDEEAKEAVRFAFRELKLVVEPGGAVSLAAILARKLDFAGKTVMAVLSGGNIDPGLFAEIIQEPRAAA